MIPAPRRSAVPGWSRRGLGGVLVGFLSEKLNPGADYLDLHGPDIRGLSAELNANGNVDALVHLWRSGDVEAAIKVIAFHVQVHALGDSLLTVVNDYLVHGCVGSGSKTHQAVPLGSWHPPPRSAWEWESGPKCSVPWILRYGRKVL